MGQDPEGGHTAAVLQLGHRAAQERAVPAEAVDDEAAHERGQLGGQDRDGAEQVGEDPAALDVPDHHGGDAGSTGEPEVHEVVGAAG